MRANSYIQGLSWIVLRATRQGTTVRIRTAIPNTSNERTLHFFTKIITHRFFRIVVSKNHARMYFCTVVVPCSKQVITVGIGVLVSG
jgi:hypothetical protein